MSIQEIFKKEPVVKEIVNEIVSEKNTYGDVWEAYTKCKEQTYSLVGWGARCKDLQNSGAYEVLIGYICNRLKI